jgi:hypothetical protein
VYQKHCGGEGKKKKPAKLSSASSPTVKPVPLISTEPAAASQPNAKSEIESASEQHDDPLDAAQEQVMDDEAIESSTQVQQESPPKPKSPGDEFSEQVDESVPKTTTLTSSPVSQESSTSHADALDPSNLSDEQLEDTIQRLLDERNRRNTVGGDLMAKFIQATDKVRIGVGSIISLHSSIIDSKEDAGDRREVKRSLDRYIQRIKSLFKDIAALEDAGSDEQQVQDVWDDVSDNPDEF